MCLPIAVEPVNAIMSTCGCAHQRLAGLLAGAGDDAHHAGRQHLEGRGQLERRERRLVGRLDDHRVAGRQRRRHLPRHEQQRIVERHDRRHHAERLLDREVDLVLEARRDGVAARVAPDLGVVVEAGGRPLDLVEVLDHRLAALERHELGELVVHARGCAPRPRAGASPSRAPGTRRHAGCARRAARTAAATSAACARGTRGDDLLGRGILDRHGLAAGAPRGCWLIDPHPDRWFIGDPSSFGRRSRSGRGLRGRRSVQRGAAGRRSACRCAGSCRPSGAPGRRGTRRARCS